MTNNMYKESVKINKLKFNGPITLLSSLEDGIKRMMISASIETSRLVAMILCETKVSITQMSHRYCNALTEDNKLLIPEILAKNNPLYSEIKPIYAYAELLYRKLLDNGVPKEDARGILPNGTKTKINITASGEQILDLFSHLYAEEGLTKNITNLLIEGITDKLSERVNNDSEEFKSYVKDFFYNINPKNKVEVETEALFSLSQPLRRSRDSIGDNFIDLIADATSRVNDKEANDDVVMRVLESGHMSILEHSLFEEQLSMDFPTYNQLIRHRHITLERQSLISILSQVKWVLNYTALEVNHELKKEIANYVNLVESQILKLLGEAYLFYCKPHITDDDNIYEVERALLCLPLFTKFNVLMSGNMRSELEIMQKRLCNRAQEPIRNIFEKIYNKRIQDEKLAKIYKKYAVPPCVHEKCPEGKLCCKKADEVKAKYL